MRKADRSPYQHPSNLVPMWILWPLSWVLRGAIAAFDGAAWAWNRVLDWGWAIVLSGDAPPEWRDLE